MCVNIEAGYLLVVLPCIWMIHFDSLPVSLELKGRTRTATLTDAPDMFETSGPILFVKICVLPTRKNRIHMLPLTNSKKVLHRFSITSYHSKSSHQQIWSSKGLKQWWQTQSDELCTLVQRITFRGCYYNFSVVEQMQKERTNWAPSRKFNMPTLKAYSYLVKYFGTKTSLGSCLWVINTLEEWIFGQNSILILCEYSLHKQYTV